MREHGRVAPRRALLWLAAVTAVLLAAVPTTQSLSSRAAYTSSTAITGNTMAPASCSAATTWNTLVPGFAPTSWLRLGDTGATLADATGATAWSTSGTITRSIPGALFCQGGATGNAVSLASTAYSVSPSQGRYNRGTEVNSYNTGVTIAAWFRGTAGETGRLVGLGDTNGVGGGATRTDRVLWIDTTGQVHFGPPAAADELLSGATFFDGRWHLVVVAMGASSATMYVDGLQVDSDPSVSYRSFGSSAVYWRLGSDVSTTRPANAPTSSFTGDVDEVMIERSTLSATDVATLYAAADGS